MVPNGIQPGVYFTLGEMGKVYSLLMSAHNMRNYVVQNFVQKVINQSPISNHRGDFSMPNANS